MQVSIANESDSIAWRSFVQDQSTGSIFHRWEWHSILSTAFSHKPHFLIAREGAEVVGVLPLAEVRTMLFGHTLASMPFCSWAGPLAASPEASDALLAHAKELCDQLGAKHLEIRRQGPPVGELPNQDLYVYFAKEISADHDKNMLAIPRKQRAMVRKGDKAGLTSDIASVDDFYRLYLNNVHRHGTPGCPKRFFAAMQQAFEQDCQIMMVRDSDNQPVSTVLSLFHHNEVLPFYAGDYPQARNLAGNDFKYWEVMRRAADRGMTRFNFGRSKKGTGSFSFKKNWGFEPQPLSYQFYLKQGDSIPQLNPSNPRYKLLISTWQKMPGWFVGALGPRLVRGLG